MIGLVEELDHKDEPAIKRALAHIQAVYIEWSAEDRGAVDYHDAGYLYGAVEAVQRAAHEKHPEDWTTWQWLQHALKELQHIAPTGIKPS